MSEHNEDKCETPAVGHHTETSTSKTPLEALSVIRVRIIDARHPFPNLAFLNLQAVPQKGDLINLEMSTGNFFGYRVEFCNVNPNHQHQITLGCIPYEVQSGQIGMTDAQIKEKQEEIAKSHSQLIDKAMTYAKTIIAAGYASGFGIWAFTRGSLSNKANEVFALAFGFSLLLFIAWEIYSMYVTARDRISFSQVVDASPTEFFARWTAFQKQSQVKDRRFIRIWRFIFWPTVILGFSAILFLMYNIAAELMEWPMF